MKSITLITYSLFCTCPLRSFDVKIVFGKLSHYTIARKRTTTLGTMSGKSGCFLGVLLLKNQICRKRVATA